MSERRSVAFTVVKERDGDEIGRVCVCERGGEGDEAVYGSRSWETMLGIWGGVDGGPSVCAGCVDVKRGWCALSHLRELYASKTCQCMLLEGEICVMLEKRARQTSETDENGLRRGERDCGDGSASTGLSGCVCKFVPGVGGEVIGMQGGKAARCRTASMDIHFALSCVSARAMAYRWQIPTPAKTEAW